MILLFAACSSNTQEPTTPSEVWSEDLALGDMAEGDVFFDTLGQVSLTIPPAGMQSLRNAPREYTLATFQWEDRVFEGVGVRLKGSSSFEEVDEKPSWKVKLDFTQDQELFGLTDLTFNNLHCDPSMLSERMAYWVYRESGLPASRAGHVQISVNGNPYGLYSNIETVSKRLLKRWYDGESDSMWEMTSSSLYFLELEVGPDDQAPIDGVLAGVEAGDLNQVGMFLDLEQTQHFFAVSAVVGQFDAFPYSPFGNDVHLAVNPATGLLEWLPHGLDESMKSRDRDITVVYGDLADLCVEDTPCRQGIRDRVLETLDLVESLDWEARVQTLRETIDQAVEDDLRRPYSVPEVVQGQVQVLRFTENRREDIFGP